VPRFGTVRRAIDERTVLVTGATDGLGRALALALASRHALVLVHGRSQSRLEHTCAEIRQATGRDRLHSYRADFSSLAEVRNLAREIERDHDRLDLLINNAGIGFGAPGAGRELSADGYELRFAVNYLAPFLLTMLLMPLLRRSAPARIVNVASAGQVPVDFDDVMLDAGYDGVRAYRQSKLAQVMFTFELAARLAAAGEEGVTVNALHPATFIDTKMVHEAGGAPMSTIDDGVEATLALALSPELDGVSGRYFNRLQDARADPQAYDPDARRRLWQLSEQLTGAAGGTAQASENSPARFRPL
jgi:NAD(P)-dependent dehydrogenase (short-subunit alcohol dehydrogenase family)